MKIRKTGANGLANKADTWYLKGFEDRLLAYCIPRVPKYIETYHLTGMTLLWSALVIIVALAAKLNFIYFLGLAPILLLQYFTDILDGTVGKVRNTGLVKWGYYMDHLLDYVFSMAFLFAHIFVSTTNNQILNFALFFLMSLSFFSSVVGGALTKKVYVSIKKVSPSEIRIMLAFFVILEVLFGVALVNLGLYVLVFALVIASLGSIYKTHSNLWNEEIRREK